MLRTSLTVVTSAVLALAAGLWLGGHPQALPGPLRDAFVESDRALRAELVDTIEENFYKPVDERKLDDASLKGIVRSLDDPFSHYLTPGEAKQFQESVSGAFEGVGMTVEEDRRGLRVLNVFDGSPAKRKGIRKGDLIVSVNGRSLAGVNSEVATGRIKVPVARSRMVERAGRKLALVQLLSFSSGAHGLLRREVEKVERRGADGILLDLRGNGGGLLTEAVLVSSI